MPPLVHSFRPLSSLHMGRSVRSPLQEEITKERCEVAGTAAKLKIKRKDLKTIKDGGILLVGISSHGVPSLILIHMHAPDITLLVHLSGISCWKHRHEFNAGRGVYICARASVRCYRSYSGNKWKRLKLCSSSCTPN